MSKILLWLFVINLGIALGAGLYEGRIALGNWLTTAPDGMHWNAEAAQNDNTGLRFWVFVTTVPLTLLTIANLIAAFRAPDALRGWWLTASGAALLDRALTFGYFIPTMVRLMRMPDSPAAVSTAQQWATLNHGRHLLVLIALLAALKTFSLLYAALPSKLVQ